MSNKFLLYGLCINRTMSLSLSPIIHHNDISSKVPVAQIPVDEI